MASYNPYQLLYGREPILLSSSWEKLAIVVDLDDPNIWAECLQERAQFFLRAMPMIHCILHVFVMVPIDLNCRDSGKEIMFMSSVRTLDVKAERTIG